MCRRQLQHVSFRNAEPWVLIQVRAGSCSCAASAIATSVASWSHFLQRLVKAAVLPFWTAIVAPLASLAVEADSCARWEPWHFGSPLGASGGRCGRSADGSAPHGWNSPDTPVMQTWRRSFAAFAVNDCGSRSATSYLTKTLRPPASGGFIKTSIQAFCLS